MGILKALKASAEFLLMNTYLVYLMVPKSQNCTPTLGKNNLEPGVKDKKIFRFLLILQVPDDGLMTVVEGEDALLECKVSGEDVVPSEEINGTVSPISYIIFKSIYSIFNILANTIQYSMK